MTFIQVMFQDCIWQEDGPETQVTNEEGVEVGEDRIITPAIGSEPG